MSSIFISYRRNDTDFQANLLCKRLRQEFGEEAVFIDVDTIPPGVDFRKHLRESVGSCEVLLAIIGDRWLDVSSDDGVPRLHDPRDFMRIEIEHALARDIPVIPILFGETGMPLEGQLPESLRDLAYRHAVHVRSGRDFETELERLINALQKHMASPSRRRQSTDDAIEVANSSSHSREDLAQTAFGESDGATFQSELANGAEVEFQGKAAPGRRTMSAKILGIDLGTTNSAIAVLVNDEVRLISTPEGHRLTPSVVAFRRNQETLVGAAALRQAVTNPANAVYSIKRFIGRRNSEIASDRGRVPYHISQGAGDDFAKVDVAGRLYTPAEISAHVLRQLKEIAEDYLNETIEKAVITVPAYFNDSQRQATKDAGEIAGLEVCRIVNEPTAAAMAYRLRSQGEQNVVVFDLGGGTLDISVLEVDDSDGDCECFTVISTCGDTQLGGDDFDLALVNHISEEFRREQGIDLRQDMMALQRLREACETAKRTLSESEAASVYLPFITSDASGPRHLRHNITRSEFEELIAPLIERCRKPLAQALRDSRLKPEDIDQVLLVGGSTRIPKVRAIVREFFGKEPSSNVNPEEVVAIGAALQGSVLSGHRKDVLLMDVTPLTLGVETEGGVMSALIERNTTIPTEKSHVFSTASDNQTRVKIHVLQGERPMASDNHSLGKFYLTDIPPAPRGVPKIQVSFDVNVNGILHVSAKDVATGSQTSVRIKQSVGMAPDEILRLRREMDSLACKDQHKHLIADLRMRTAKDCDEAERLLEQYENTVPDNLTAAVSAALTTCRQLALGDDLKAMREAASRLDGVIREMFQALHGST